MFLKQLFTVALFFTAMSISAQKYVNTENVDITKTYKSTSFSSTFTFAENMMKAPSFSVLAEILKNDTSRSIIEKEEMVTIFASLDASLSALTDEEKEVFMADTALQSQLLKMHSVPGRLDSESLKKALEANGGKSELKTLAGTKLTVVANKSGDIVISDDKGNKANIVATDFYHKNGFFHIVEGVAAPLIKQE